jgi:hypothetical protein
VVSSSLLFAGLLFVFVCCCFVLLSLSSLLVVGSFALGCFAAVVSGCFGGPMVLLLAVLSCCGTGDGVGGGWGVAVAGTARCGGGPFLVLAMVLCPGCSDLCSWISVFHTCLFEVRLYRTSGTKKFRSVGCRDFGWYLSAASKILLVFRYRKV